MNNIDIQYQKLCKEILDYGFEKNTRNGKVLSIFGATIRHNMGDGFPLLTTKKMAWKTIVTELLWFLRGDTNIKFLLDNDCHIWDGDAYKNYAWKTSMDTDDQLTKEGFINRIKTDDEFAKKWGELGPIYGKQWRKWHTRWDVVDDDSKKFGIRKVEYGIDQITNLISELKTNPDSRRLMVSAYNVGELDQMVLPPCHYGFQVYTRELSHEERISICLKRNPETKFAAHVETNEILMNDWNIPTRAISLMWNQRSVDVPLGLPFNIASYGLLLEIIAKTVNMVPEMLIGNLGDCHIYENQIEGIEEQLTREPFELPTLKINTEFWPTENGSCGEGPIDAIAVFNAFKDDSFCKCLLEEDIQLWNYQCHPKIHMTLSN